MKELKYVEGDVREPIGEGNKLICHIVNDQGCMGSGVARSLYEKWPQVRDRYIHWYDVRVNGLDSQYKGIFEFTLGYIQLVSVESNIYVANMIAQHMVGQDENGFPPIRYDALINCLRSMIIR